MVAQDSHQLPTRDLFGETGGRLLRAVVDLHTVVTLHDELVAIPRSEGNRWMTLPELATGVSARGRYAKRDGSALRAGQINLRTRAGGFYEHLRALDEGHSVPGH